MSITYDPEKWTNPLRASEPEEPVKKSRAPVLVSINETRYFKVRQKSIADDVFNSILTAENVPVSQDRTTSTALLEEDASKLNEPGPG